MNKKVETVEAYNKSAKALADKFDSQGARVSDIEETFSLVNKENPVVFEIGCGNGRDAKEILKHTDNYLGMDISEELIRLAREKNPNAHFEVGDIETSAIPSNLDVVFAFASLLHVDKGHLREIMGRLCSSMNERAVFNLSLKYNDEYKEVLKEDEFGRRTFYLYSEKDIKEVTAGFEVVKIKKLELRGQWWIEVLLRK